VHRSNFRLEGFVDEVDAAELAELGKRHSVLTVFDIGSGAYHRTEDFGMEPEPTIRAALESGADLVCFSGDKLLAAVQGGVVLGSQKLIARLNRNPIYRALRPDKLTIAMMEETVFAYLKKQDDELLPLWRMMSIPVTELRERAAGIAEALAEAECAIAVVDSKATPGGGSLPGGELESVAVAITPAGKAAHLSRRLLNAGPPLIGYVEDERLYLDLRTIAPDEDETVIRILRDNL
jgi:L-seryl-tRNA(Ser) seleniumtransferase